MGQWIVGLISFHKIFGCGTIFCIEHILTGTLLISPLSPSISPIISGDLFVIQSGPLFCSLSAPPLLSGAKSPLSAVLASASCNNSQWGPFVWTLFSSILNSVLSYKPFSSSLVFCVLAKFASLII